MLDVRLLRPGWLSRKNIWLQLSVSSMVQAFILHLLGGLIWVQPSVPKTTSEITQGITFLNGLMVCLSYPLLLLLNLMLHIQFLHMGSPRNGNTNPHIGDLLSPLELEIRQQFLPTLIPHPPSDLECELFGLPVSLGGLGICDPCRISTDDYNFSLELSRPLVDLILHQHGSLPHDVIDSQCIILKQLSQAKYQSQIDATQSVLARSFSIMC